MFEFEDISSGFHDIFHSKYSDSSGPILDFVSDSMQDMLDIDIISEVATVIGGVNDISPLMNDMPAMEFESSSNDDDFFVGGPKWSATSDIYADVGACINPNSVHSQTPAVSSSILTSPKAQLNLNVNNYQSTNSPLPSPKEKKSHLTFSPNTIKVPVVQEAKKQSLLCQPQRTTIDSIKKDLNIEMKEDKILKPISQSISVTNQTTQSPTITTTANTNTIKLGPGIGGLTFANSLMYAKLKQNKVVTSGHLTSVKREVSPPVQYSNSVINGGVQLSNNVHQQNPQKVFSRSIIFQNNKTTNNQHTQQQLNGSINGSNKLVKPKPDGEEFPKPAYSYSCLIAMALKNSRAGSLPVSEIYSFMCEHFPYFKKAPNGWKNSVRHNLSLNKCFEKIEKPATNGGQRKGCLWGMNPSKISKMDDEIQKWSRKDSMAIRKAMVYPDNLELLERGEIKHGSMNDSEGENDTEDMEENSDPEQDTDLDDVIINTTEPESGDEDERNSQLDFDVEVNDLYGEVDISDLHLVLNKKELVELTENDLPSQKRARLDVNYSIGPAGAFTTLNGSQQTQQNRRKMTLVNRIV